MSRLSSRISSSSTLDSWFDIRDFTLTFTIAIEFNWIPGWLSCLQRGEFTQSWGPGLEAGPDVFNLSLMAMSFWSRISSQMLVFN